MAGRRLPRWSELKPLLRPKPIPLDTTDRRLGSALTIADLRTIARRRARGRCSTTPTAPPRRRSACAGPGSCSGELEFQPSILQDVSDGRHRPRASSGRPAALPFAFAPTGFTRMMHHEGERAVVRVAQRRGIPYALSTMGTTSIEDVAAAAPDARKWFQLYVWKDRRAGEDLMARAKAAGYEALMLTVDVPVGRRPAARRPQRLLDPAGADRQDRAGRRDRTPPGGSTC